MCEAYMGRFPVISISLKGVSGNDFETARAMMCAEIGSEAMRFGKLMESDIFDRADRELYQKLVRMDSAQGDNFVLSDSALMESLKTLARLLQKYYGSKVIILIDEYDVPLARAFYGGYYDQMAELVRGLFQQALKINDSLQFAVLTGCLRISRESIFTSLNNLRVLSVGDVRFDEYFGFTDGEVQALLEYYRLSDFYGRIKVWYDGYHFGDVDVYCPGMWFPTAASCVQSRGRSPRNTG